MGPEVRPRPVLSLLVPSGHSPSPRPHSAWHTLPCTVQGLQGQVTVARTLGLRHAVEGQERAVRPCGLLPQPDVAYGPLWAGFHFRWRPLVCSSPPTAPVHTGPELPTPRREVQSEGAGEPGEGGPAGAGPVPLHPGGGGSPPSAQDRRRRSGWARCPRRKRWSPGPEGAAGRLNRRSSGRAGAVTAPAGGADLQGVPGPRRGHRLCALRTPGLCRVRTSPAAMPHLQGPHPQLCAHLPVLGQVSGHGATHGQTLAWPDLGTSPLGLRVSGRAWTVTPSTPCPPPSQHRGGPAGLGGRRALLTSSSSLVLADVANQPIPSLDAQILALGPSQHSSPAGHCHSAWAL